MSTDNRALWELVDELHKNAATERGQANNKSWAEWLRERYAGRATGYSDAATRLSAILERPVVVGDYEMFAKYFEQNYNGTVVFAKPRWHAERLWRIAKRAMSLNPETNESMVRGKS